MKPTPAEIRQATEAITQAVGRWQQEHGPVRDNKEGRATVEAVARNAQRTLARVGAIREYLPDVEVVWDDLAGRAQPRLIIPPPPLTAEELAHRERILGDLRGRLDADQLEAFERAGDTAGAVRMRELLADNESLRKQIDELKAHGEDASKLAVQLDQDHDLIAGLAHDAAPLIRSYGEMLRQEAMAAGVPPEWRSGDHPRVEAWLARFEKGDEGRCDGTFKGMRCRLAKGHYAFPSATAINGHDFGDEAGRALVAGLRAGAAPYARAERVMAEAAPGLNASASGLESFRRAAVDLGLIDEDAERAREQDERRARIDKALAGLDLSDAGVAGAPWWWLSFADGERPKGDRFLGACLVQAPGGLVGATRRAHVLGINPGGEVMGSEISSQVSAKLPPSFCNRLLTRAECEAFDRAMEAAL